MAKYQILKPNEKKSITKEFKYYPLITDELDNLNEKGKNITKEDLHQITLWKVNRFPFSDIGEPTEILKELNSLKGKKFNEEEAKRVLRILLNETGVGLPMASTYLRFINPNAYQIIDRHAYRAAFNYQKKFPYAEKKVEKLIDVYFDYLNELRIIAEKGYHGYKVAFKDLDRFLYDVDNASDFKLDERLEVTRNAKKEDIIKWIEDALM